MSRGVRWLPLLLSLMLTVSGLIPPPPPAQSATRLYVGHDARLTAQMPADWHVDPSGTFNYIGANGLVLSLALAGATLDEACQNLAADPRFEAPPAVSLADWSGQQVCRLEGRAAGHDVVAMVMPHPYPLLRAERVLAFAGVVVDRAHSEVLLRTASFDPGLVDSAAYYSSLLDILKVRSYFSEAVNWELLRSETFATIHYLPSLETSRGLLPGLVTFLRLAGDRHSSVVLANGEQVIQAQGFGLLVGGTQVLVAYPNGPAFQAGVRAGDRIASINGTPFLPTFRPMMLEQTAPRSSLNGWGASIEVVLSSDEFLEPYRVTIERGAVDRYLPPSGQRLSDPAGLGLLALSGFAGSGYEADFARAGNHLLATLDQPAACGWVLDLRLTGGEQAAPLIAILGPLLGNGDFAGYQRRNGATQVLTYQDGRISLDRQVVSQWVGDPLYLPQNPGAPVAVLTSASTEIAGEVATAALVGRADTRFFGERTAGLTTGMTQIHLFDGSSIAFSESALTDRFGRVYPDGISPDQVIPTDWNSFQTDQDPVLNAARGWLAQQPACIA